MKKFLLATVGLVAFGIAAPASAADLYTKAPPPVVPIYDWSGFYIGANGGGGWSHKCWDVTNFRAPITAFSEGCHDASGGVVGGQIGYRWQSAGWVFGLEGQGNWADLNGSNVSLSFPPEPTIPRSKRSACSPARSAMPGITSFGM
jgi:outer membrane immunogenic protein